METKDLPQGIVGFKFANALVRRDFDEAWSMLCTELRLECTTSGLKERYESMISYAQPERPPDVEVLDNSEVGLGELDARGRVYVALIGDGWSEAVTVTVETIGSGHVITELTWGRP